MQLKRLLGTATAVVAFTGAAVMYSVHPAKSSDHQDTYNLANAVGHNPSADITDVFVFPAPDDPTNKVVLAMDTYPLIGAGLGTSKFFDPTIMWQFKISHGAITNPEDTAFQIQATGTGASQVLTLLEKTSGAATTSSTFTGSTVLANATYNIPVATNNVQFFAGPRADPFYFDLFEFFSFLGDRNYATHSGQDAGGSGTPLSNGDNFTGSPATDADKANNPSQPSFNGFPKTGTPVTAGAGSALGNYACLTAPSQNALADLGGGFDVLSFVVEIPKTMLSGGGQNINVWATSSSSATNT